MSVAVRAERALGEHGRSFTGGESAGLALQTMRDAILDRLRGHVEPDRQIERRLVALQNAMQRFRLRNRARKTVEDEAVRAVQTDPVFDQLDDDLVRNEFAVFGLFRGLNSEQRPQFHFPPQNRAGRGHWNSKVARDHFRLGSLSGTGRTEEDESLFHLAPVEEK